MDLIKIVIEFDGKITINNELIIFVLPHRPFAIEWFLNNDLIIETHEKIIFNSNSPQTTKSATIIKIPPNTYIIRPDAHREPEMNLTVIVSKQLFIFPKRYNVELACGTHTSYMTVNNKNEKIAIDLGTRVTDGSFEVSNLNVILKAKSENNSVFVVFNPTTGKTEHHVIADAIEYKTDSIIAVKNLRTLLGHNKVTRFGISNGAITFSESYTAKDNVNASNKIERHEIPFALLQCISAGDFNSARELLAFDISDEHLAGYFGDFEILLNNYLDTQNIISILSLPASKYTVARNIRFSIDNNKIINITDG